MEHDRACLMKTLVFLNLLLLTTLAVAQNVYKWVDEDGEVHYSQTLPPEQTDDGYDRLTSDGLLAERVGRVKTEEELAELRARQKEQREQEELTRLQAQQDRLFLAAYPTEADVRRAIESRRKTVLAEKNSVQALIEQSRGRFADAVERAATLERRGEPVPEALVSRIADARSGIRELNDRLSRINARLAELDEELAAELERHRRLTDSG